VYILPVRYSVDPVIEDVNKLSVYILLENEALFAAILEIERVPPEFKIAVELKRIEDTFVALIVLYTIRLLVAILFEAIISRLLIPGTAIPSEKRRLSPRYAIDFS
jgi:hypothetical protein